MKQRSKRRARRLRGQLDILPARPLRTSKLLHVGIARRPRERTADAGPLTDRHQAVLEQLGPELRGSSAIARQLGLTVSQVTAALFVLADRGLAERVPYKGWRRTEPSTTQEE